MARFEVPTRPASGLGVRTVRAFVAGSVGAALALFICWFLPVVDGPMTTLITVVGALLGAWLGSWTPKRGPGPAADSKTSSTPYVGARAPDEASVPDASAPRERRPVHS